MLVNDSRSTATTTPASRTEPKAAESILRLFRGAPLGFQAGDANLYRYVSNAPTNLTDPSGLAECDDREGAPGNRRLVDVRTQLEAYVNGVIGPIQARYQGEVRTQIIRPTTDRTEADMMQRYAEQTLWDVYRALGDYQPGTGVNALGASRAQLSRIEAWFTSSNGLSSARNEINQLTFRQSRYRFNTVGRGVIGSHPWWFATDDEAILNHGIAPTIRISGTLMGTDKWGHFFQQGYWLHRFNVPELRVPFSQYLEGCYDATGRPRGEAASLPPAARYWGSSEGIQGARASGVISHADMRANLEGASFYDGLYAAFMRRETFVFRVADYRTHLFNEAVMNLNDYVRGTRVDDTNEPWVPPRISPWHQGAAAVGGHS